MCSKFFCVAAGCLNVECQMCEREALMKQKLHFAWNRLTEFKNQTQCERIKFWFRLLIFRIFPEPHSYVIVFITSPHPSCGTVSCGSVGRQTFGQTQAVSSFPVSKLTTVKVLSEEPQRLLIVRGLWYRLLQAVVLPLTGCGTVSSCRLFYCHLLQAVVPLALAPAHFWEQFCL